MKLNVELDGRPVKAYGVEVRILHIPTNDDGTPTGNVLVGVTRDLDEQQDKSDTVGAGSTGTRDN